jgi:hypothetical protein
LDTDTKLICTTRFVTKKYALNRLFHAVSPVNAIKKAGSYETVVAT